MRAICATCVIASMALFSACGGSSGGGDENGNGPGEGNSQTPPSEAINGLEYGVGYLFTYTTEGEGLDKTRIVFQQTGSFTATYPDSQESPDSGTYTYEPGSDGRTGVLSAHVLGIATLTFTQKGQGTFSIYLGEDAPGVSVGGNFRKE